MLQKAMVPPLKRNSKLTSTPFLLLSSHGTVFAVCLVVCVLLALTCWWPIALRNLDSIRLLHNPAADLATLNNARPYLLGTVALNRGEAATSLHYFVQTDYASNFLARNQYVRALALQPNSWREALAMVAREQPLPRYLLYELLVTHLPEFTAEELQSWRKRLQRDEPLLLTDIALALLLQGDNEEAEQWARSVPHFAMSPDAKRIVGQANLNRGRYNKAVSIFQELYGENASALNSYWYGRSLLLAGRYDLSIAMLEKAVNTTDYDLAWYLADLALAYGLDGECEAANRTATSALTHDNSRNLQLRVEQVLDTIGSVCPE